MLTKDIILKNEALKGLTEEQINAITSLSENDESTVIANKTREIYQGIDNDIKQATGLEKPGTEKTYDFLKRVLGEKVNESQTTKTALEALKAEKEALEVKIKTGGASEEVIKSLEQKVKDAENRVNELRGKLTEEETKFTTAIAEKDAQLYEVKVDNYFNQILTGLTFKDEKLLDKQVRETFITNVLSSLKKDLKPVEIDNGAGGKTFAFEKEPGVILNNPANGLKPYTGEELLKEKLLPVLDLGKKTNGAGSGPNGAPGADIVDLKGAKTQLEADEIIRAQLLKDGLNVLDPSFATKAAEMREAAKVAELPVR